MHHAASYLQRLMPCTVVPGHTHGTERSTAIYRAAITLSLIVRNRERCLQHYLRYSRSAVRFIPIISFRTTDYMKLVAQRHVNARGKKYISRMLAISIYSVYSL